MEGREGLGVDVLDQILSIGAVAGHPQGRAVELVQIGQRIRLKAGGALGLGLRARGTVDLLTRLAVGINQLVQVALVQGRGHVIRPGGLDRLDLPHRPRA